MAAHDLYELRATLLKHDKHFYARLVRHRQPRQINSKRTENNIIVKETFRKMALSNTHHIVDIMLKFTYVIFEIVLCFIQQHERLIHRIEIYAQKQNK